MIHEKKLKEFEKTLIVLLEESSKGKITTFLQYLKLKYAQVSQKTTITFK